MIRRQLLQTAAGFTRPQDFQMFADDASRGRLKNRHERRRYRMTGGGDAGSTAGIADKQMAANNDAQRAVLALARPMIQQTATISDPGDNVPIGKTYTQVLNNVGLNTKIILEVSGNIRCAGAESLFSTDLGIMNLFSNVTLTDLSNYQRINTNGGHLFLLASLRRQQPFACAFATDTPVNLGSTWPVQTAPRSVVGAVKKPFRIYYELPLAYGPYDLRGAIYAQVTSAQWRLQFTVNPNFVIPNTGTDAVLSSYISSAAGVGILSDLGVNVYQYYLDQIPPGQGGMPLLPMISLAWNYLIMNAPQTGLLANADFAVPYANFRTFLSTMAIFDNGGVGRNGTDVNYVALQVANQTFLEKLGPYFADFKSRDLLGTDGIPGLYLFDHRRWPINTNQYGNTQFVLNPSTLTQPASLLMFYEMLSIQAQAINAGSLAQSG